MPAALSALIGSSEPTPWWPLLSGAACVACRKRRLSRAGRRNEKANSTAADASAAMRAANGSASMRACAVPGRASGNEAACTAGALLSHMFTAKCRNTQKILSLHGHRHWSQPCLAYAKFGDQVPSLVTKSHKHMPCIDIWAHTDTHFSHSQ